VSLLFALALIGGLLYFLYWLVTSWSDESSEEEQRDLIDEEN
jgi:hypothetical protein